MCRIYGFLRTFPFIIFLDPPYDPYKVKIIAFILLLCKLRGREIKYVAQDHTYSLKEELKIEIFQLQVQSFHSLWPSLPPHSCRL